MIAESEKRDVKRDGIDNAHEGKCDCWDVHKNLDLDRHTCGCPCHRDAKREREVGEEG